MDWLVISGLVTLIAGATRVVAGRLRKRKQHQPSSSKSSGRAPLREVVAGCEARWFTEDLKEAMKGDQRAMVRVGHMLMAGFGVQQNKEQAAKWLRQIWAIQSFKDEVGLEIFDWDESPIPALGWREEQKQDRRQMAKERQMKRRRKAWQRHEPPPKRVEEIYGIFEDELRASGTLTPKFFREVGSEVWRRQAIQTAKDDVQDAAGDRDSRPGMEGKHEMEAGGRSNQPAEGVAVGGRGESQPTVVQGVGRAGRKM